MSPSPLASRTLALLLLLAGTALARAEFLQPVAVRVTNGEGTQDALINGQGFDEPGLGSPSARHVASAAEMWSGIGSIRESATFDLGKAVSLTRVYVWNYNAPDATDVGMREVEVQVSSDADLANANAVFNTIARISLKEGGDAAQVFDVVGTNVRLVRLKGLSNWGQGYTVGLAEVRFESGDVTGNVPAIVLNSPRDGDEVAFGADVTVDARISDREGLGDLAKVELFDGDTLVTNRVALNYNVVLKGLSRGEHALRLVATDKSGKSAWVTATINVRELVADRIEKIDDTADEGTGLGQIRYVGTWNLAQGNPSDPRYLNNDHYNLGTGRTDYFEVRFKGVKIDLFATVASHHGTGMASIDGGPEVKVVYKATQRKEQAFVWGSPILANKEHVLKVRVAGDGVVTADRFDVSVSDQPDLATATLRSFARDQVVLEWTDVGSSIIEAASVTLALDGRPVQVTAAKSGVLTTVSHQANPLFEPGSSHTAVLSAKETSGKVLTREFTFTLPAPPFPLTGLGLHPNPAGQWSVRQIWNAGRADAVVSAVDILRRSREAGFTGAVHDSASAVLNFALSTNPGGASFIPDDLPLPAESVGLSASDFLVLARTRVKIPRAGDWTLGVHTDDGFALRLVGASFDSVHGNGLADENFPEFIAHPTETGNSSTRGILRNLAAGEYDLEFLAFQRVGGASFEVYAAEGAFTEDSETDTWRLIGGSEGLELVAPAVPLTIDRLVRSGTQVVIEFTSAIPAASHVLEESADLRVWQPVVQATMSALDGGRARATAPAPTAASRFYRLRRP